jgi:hypothetical protein
MVGSLPEFSMKPPGSVSAAITPHELAARILREHDARRAASPSPWSWDDDPDGSKLVALAAMVSRWKVDGPQFEAKLQRLIRLPTGVARPAAERMLALWHAAQRESEPSQ